MKLSRPFAFDHSRMLGVGLRGDELVLVTRLYAESAYDSIWDANTEIFIVPPGSSNPAYQLLPQDPGSDVLRLKTVELHEYLVGSYRVRVGWVDMGAKRYILTDGQLVPLPETGGS